LNAFAEDCVVGYNKGGVVVDHHDNVSWLERRVRERYGLTPVLIAPVTPVGRRDLQWRGGRQVFE
jgi:hypothetical protein